MKSKWLFDFFLLLFFIVPLFHFNTRFDSKTFQFNMANLVRARTMSVDSMKVMAMVDDNENDSKTSSAIDNTANKTRKVNVGYNVTQQETKETSKENQGQVGTTAFCLVIMPHIILKSCFKKE